MRVLLCLYPPFQGRCFHLNFVGSFSENVISSWRTGDQSRKVTKHIYPIFTLFCWHLVTATVRYRMLNYMSFELLQLFFSFTFLMLRASRRCFSPVPFNLLSGVDKPRFVKGFFFFLSFQSTNPWYAS